MPHTVIIDYGSGNLRSAEKAVERVAPEGMQISVTDDIARIATASHLMLPGVGAFGDCIAGLNAVDGLRDAIATHVLEQQKPFLGICVGMQLMAETGLEHGTHSGFGWLPAHVSPITPADPLLKIPHMGWNTLEWMNSAHPVLKGIEEGDHAYFVHSYHMQPDTPTATPDWLLATTEYGGPVTAIVGRDNIIGTQFHPEKSQTTGLRLLENFLRWRP